MHNKEFGKLLSEGVRSVANRQRKKMGDVQRDIGDLLGFAHHTVQCWQAGRHIPPDEIVAFLAKYCVQNGRVRYKWCKKFLKQAKYANPREILLSLFPSQLYLFLTYQRAQEPSQSIALEMAQAFGDQGYHIFFEQPSVLDQHQKEKLKSRLAQSDYLICLLSPTALHSQQVAWQLQLADKLWQQKSRPDLLPVWLGGSTKLIEQLPSSFKGLQWSICLSQSDIPRVMAELEQSLSTNKPLPLMLSTLTQLCEEQPSQPWKANLTRIPFLRQIFSPPQAHAYFSYQPGVDEALVLEVAEKFKQRNYAIYLNHEDKMSHQNLNKAQSKLSQADYVIFFLSTEAIYSELILSELQQLKLGTQEKKPRLLAVWLASPARCQDLHSPFESLEEWAFWQHKSDTQRVIAELEQAMSRGKPLPFRRATLSKLMQHSSPPQASSLAVTSVTPQLVGALPPDSPFYVERAADEVALAQLAKKNFTLTIKGSRQMGKSSLLQRLGGLAPQVGKRFIWLDCDLLSQATSFWRYFCDLLTFKFGLANQVSDEWSYLSSPLDCTEYVAQEILPHLKRPCILALDRSESLFDTPYQNDFFAMLRIWHNYRATAKEWQSLNLIVTTSTEPHCFIENLHQSPFNVGEVLELKDFTLAQVAALNLRYGSPLNNQEIHKLMMLVQGQPYLVQRSLYLITNQRYNPLGLFQQASHERGPFADHLRALFWRLLAKEDLRQAMRQVIDEHTCPNDTLFFRLHGAGLVRFGNNQQVVPRCKLYADFFEQYFER